MFENFVEINVGMLDMSLLNAEHCLAFDIDISTAGLRRYCGFTSWKEK